MSAKFNKKYYFIILIGLTLCMVSPPLMAQSDDLYDYQREFIWGVSKNTNSGLIGGVAGKMSKKTGNNRFQTFGLEIVNVKHPQELRRASISGNTYIYRKSNHLFSIRPQYGREWVLFKKAPQQGVQVNAILAGGPTLGIVMPYYVQFAEGPSTSATPVTIPYTTPFEIRDDRIIGPGPYLRGIREGAVQLKPGVNIKASLAFEFGTFKNDVTGFEAGFQLEAFTEKIPIVMAADNRQIYPSAFIMLFYGSRK